VRERPASFYFDLASPLCYLAAERVLHALALPVHWQPVLARELPSAKRSPGAPTNGSAPAGEEPLSTHLTAPAPTAPGGEDPYRAYVAELARELALQPLRWPAEFPFDSALAMRAATYANSIGRGVAFAQAAFRQAFAGGRDLGERDGVLIAAASCEMHPAAVLAALERRGIARELEQATVRATGAGIVSVPALGVGGRVFAGEHALARAAAHVGATAAGAP
jgi:2-hydroxychromene-2-carboxylate isomerase